MSAAPLVFRLEGACWTLRILPTVVHFLAQYAQTNRLQRESVGQLYARDLTGNSIDIELATLLPPKWSLRTRVKFNTQQAMEEREAKFKEGLHCVGLWHTHPEKTPEPSREDHGLAREHALAARPQLAGLVFVIVGNAPVPHGLGIWIDDGELLRRCWHDTPDTPPKIPTQARMRSKGPHNDATRA
ncbi:Mov34/MPN/PAD-1 family protein [Acidovorax sp.]|uniref:Mov34/MPN/PAD-1 family protein n=1 Tax=Acidovorax sp. TaxID=1872122 RepID=UPI00391F36A3